MRSKERLEMERLRSILQLKHDQCMMGTQGNMPEREWSKGFRECLEMVLREIGDL